MYLDWSYIGYATIIYSIGIHGATEYLSITFSLLFNAFQQPFSFM